MPELYFMRDSRGVEVDLIFRRDHEHLFPVEIKGSATWNPDFTCNLQKIRKLSPKFSPGYVIYSGTLTPEINGIQALNYKNTATIFQV